MLTDTGKLLTPTFHRGWETWIAENLMNEVDVTKMVAVMVRDGFDSAFARQRIEEARHSPAVEAGRALAHRRRKLAALLSALGEMYKESRFARQPLHRDITAEQFYEQYFALNRPVVVPGLMRDWPALGKWTPELFATRFGDEVIEITSDRERDPRFEDNFPRHRSNIKMREYVDRLLASGESNDVYLVAKNALLVRPEFASLFDDFHCPEGFLDKTRADPTSPRLWFGPKGTLTPLHHDGSNIFFGQILGRKQVKLIAPYFIDAVYNDRLCFSPVDLENIDYSRYPRMREVLILDVIVEPGDFLFIPVGWWHWVKSLDVSISLSFHNFFFSSKTVVWNHNT